MRGSACRHIGGALLMLGGPDHVIVADGKRWNFEMHPVCGPVVLNAKGDPLNHQPGPRSDLWTAVTLWAQQGQQVDSEGVCVWVPPVAELWVHMGGRHHALAGSALAQHWELTQAAARLRTEPPR